MIRCVGAVLLGCLWSVSGIAAETDRGADGQIPATVVRVIDGDSLSVKAKIWIGQTVETVVRINGIDAPELKGQCAKERAAARAARDYVQELLGKNRTVMLHKVKKDKYGGRVTAVVVLPDGRDLGETMVKAKHARPYHGSKRRPWCP